MRNSLVFISLLILIAIEMVFSFPMMSDMFDEYKLDDVRSLSSNSPLTSGSSSVGKQGNGPECLTKALLANILSRERRASISRPYFHHWRQSRDNNRYGSKNLLAFSPRLGKRSTEEENDAELFLNERQVDEGSNTADLDAFLVTLVGYLQRRKIDIVYEDATKICLSQAISDAVIQEVFDKFDANRRQQDEQDKEEAKSRHSKSKHPVLFRYRLGK